MLDCVGCSLARSVMRRARSAVRPALDTATKAARPVTGRVGAQRTTLTDTRSIDRAYPATDRDETGAA